MFKTIKNSDALDMGVVIKKHADGNAELRALLAGNDILLCPADVPAGVAATKQVLADGSITEEEIDTHVELILCTKHKINIQTHP